MSIESQIISSYRKNRNNYIRLEKIVDEKIKAVINEKHYFVLDVNHRIKTIDSLQGKLVKKHGKYENLLDITDLCGFRIITYFSDTVDDIALELGRIFEIDWDNSIDKRANLQETQFGYLSLHYVCTLKPEDGYDEELCKIKFEIQIRTALQHAWAEIEHDLGYKSEFGVPRAIRREFSRIAGLLEVADEQFVDLRHKTREYVLEIKEKIAGDEADELLLDQVTLSEYVSSNRHFIQYINDFSEELGVDIEPSNIDRYIECLDWLGVSKLGNLIEMLKDNRDFMLKICRGRIDKYEIDIITYSVIFRYLCVAELIISKYSDEQIEKFTKLYYENEDASKYLLEGILALKKDYAE